MKTLTYNMSYELHIFLVPKKITESYLNSKLVMNLSLFKIYELILHKIRLGKPSIYSVINRIKF